MRRMPVGIVGPSLIALLVVCPAADGRAVANDAGPTVFQRAIRSWMGVVTLLAEEGESASAERSDGEAKRGDGARADHGHAMRGERGDREGRGPREGSRDRGPGPRGPGWRMHAPPGMPPPSRELLPVATTKSAPAVSVTASTSPTARKFYPSSTA